MHGPETILDALAKRRFSPLDLIDKDDALEKVLAITLAERIEPALAPHVAPLLEDFRGYSTAGQRAVVFGGGSGLSSVVGGANRAPSWADAPFDGLKCDFEELSVVVCTTDDGGSTGLILRELELIALGDLRNVCLSLVRPELLEARYGVRGDDARAAVAAIARIVNHRIDARRGRLAANRVVADPAPLLEQRLQQAMPARLLAYFRELGAYLESRQRLRVLLKPGQCLGNLYLLAAILRRQRGEGPPKERAVTEGIGAFANALGAPGDRIYPATTAPGQLRFLYGNGVAVRGQRKALVSRRGFAVERVVADYVRTPTVDPRLVRAIRSADLILFAPGSLYSSLMPVLQLPEIVDAIRANASAVKVLAANFWVQEGETDVTRRGARARFTVSDMLDAYDRNVPGGVRGIFGQVLAADMKQLPGHVLRNYALEGKLPIILDRDRVRAMGFQPVEAPVFSRRSLASDRVLRHDPERFARAIKTLLYMRRTLDPIADDGPKNGPVFPSRIEGERASPAACMRAFRDKIAGLDLRPARLAGPLEELLWRNRDVLPEHLDQFRGIRVVPVGRWKRSTEWDKVLGYFDPEDRYLKIHAQLLDGPVERLCEDILIGIGEALLGRYFLRKAIEPLELDGVVIGKVYSVRLRPVAERDAFLTDEQLRQYLELAKMVRSDADPDVYRMAVNGDAAFLGPGLQFGLLYAWYLDNAYGGLTDYEMSLVRWPARDLVPYQTDAMRERRRLIRFFREVVFRHADDSVETILADAATTEGAGDE